MTTATTTPLKITGARGPARFDGATYDAAQDKVRLSAQAEMVFRHMKDGAWHTLEYLSLVTNASEASASARLRDLRKPRFGGHTVERRRHATRPGVFEYRLVVKNPGA